MLVFSVAGLNQPTCVLTPPSMICSLTPSCVPSDARRSSAIAPRPIATSMLSSNTTLLEHDGSLNGTVVMTPIAAALPAAVESDTNPFFRSWRSCKPDSTVHGPVCPLHGGRGSPTYPPCVY